MRRRFPFVATVLAVGVAACGSSPGTVGSVPLVTVHVALPAGVLPSISAKMVCTPKTQRELADVLGVKPVTPIAPTWVDHVYSCHYQYADGVMVLAVKELSDKAETTAYFTMLGAQLGDAGTLPGLGQGAFTTGNGSVVVRKDYKVMLVDISALPAQFGVPPTTAADVAITVADEIMGCWSGS